MSVARLDEASLAPILATGRRRMREFYAHHPAELVVAVNGKEVAVRDIGSARCTLKVEARGPDPLELVEVFSEQGVLMLLLPVSGRPPCTPPSLTREVTLSGDRVLFASIRFSGDGALIEVFYSDPHFSAAALHEEDADRASYTRVEARDPFPAVSSPTSAAAFLPGQAQARISRWSKVLLLPLRNGIRMLAPMLAMGLVTLLVVWVSSKAHDQPVEASDLLTNAVRSERQSLNTFGTGMVHQALAIRTSGRTLKRDVFRDTEGRRRRLESQPDADERDLRTRLAEADIDWNDPLSAADFSTWRARNNLKSDRVETLDNGLVRLTTVVDSGPVLNETLTVRLRDFHATARKTTFRDQQAIEIAELSYDLEPWTPDNERLFSPSPGDVHPRAARVSPAHPAPYELSEDQLDLARLSLLLALQEMHADAERINVSASQGKVFVSGIVESDARKLEIVARLQTIPHVSVRILSYSDADSQPAANAGTDSIRAVSAAAADTPLDLYCAGRHFPREHCRLVAQQILRASGDLFRAELLLRQLSAAYPSSHPLTEESRFLLEELRQNYRRHLNESALNLNRAVQSVDPDLPSAAPAAAEDLHSLIESARSFTRELLYVPDGQARAAQDIIKDLADSTDRILAVLPRAEPLTANRTVQ